MWTAERRAEGVKKHKGGSHTARWDFASNDSFRLYPRQRTTHSFPSIASTNEQI